MKKDTTPASAGGDTPPADDAPAATQTSAKAAAKVAAPITDAAAQEGEQHFDPKHEWPAAGGCYVRQADGTLKRED